MLVNARGVQHKLLAGGYCVDSIYTAVKTINRYKSPQGLRRAGFQDFIG
jgi:hypothetical protein